MADHRETGVAGEFNLPRRSRFVSLVEMNDGEGALYDPRSGELYAMNPTALDVWAMCDGTHGLEAMVHELRDLYQLDDAASTRQDIEQTIRQFWDSGLLGDEPDGEARQSA